LQLIENKLNLENWQNLLLHPSKEEAKDYVLVGEPVWNMIKKTFGGGPTIQFFLLGDENILRQDELIKQTNLIYSKDYSLYGYPDINPEYYELALEIKDTSNGEEVLKIPYKLLLSKHMT